MSANERQVGGDHYKGAPCPHCGNPLQHWDIAWAFRFDQFQYCISKYIWRKKGPGGRQLIADLEKAKHHLEKYIEVMQAAEEETEGLAPGPEYVNQD